MKRAPVNFICSQGLYQVDEHDLMALAPVEPPPSGWVGRHLNDTALGWFWSNDFVPVRGNKKDGLFWTPADAMIEYDGTKNWNGAYQHIHLAKALLPGLRKVMVTAPLLNIYHGAQGLTACFGRYLNMAEAALMNLPEEETLEARRKMLKRLPEEIELSNKMLRLEIKKLDLLTGDACTPDTLQMSLPRIFCNVGREHFGRALTKAGFLDEETMLVPGGLNSLLDSPRLGELLEALLPGSAEFALLCQTQAPWNSVVLAAQF